jgi:shikimate kinase
MNVVLIGMAGAGKSLTGRFLADALGYAFIDTDKALEAKHGEPLQAILDRLGDGAFIRAEEAEILSLVGIDRAVIAPGGSVIYSAEAMRYLKSSALAVYLRVPPETLEARIDPATRGIVGLKDRAFRELYAEREAAYIAAADLTIEADGKTAEQVAAEIFASAAPVLLPPPS